MAAIGNSGFTCSHTPESFFTNRLSFQENQHSPEKEALTPADRGVTEYGNILGRFLVFIGFAFNTKDESNNDLYINNKSYCNYIKRLYPDAPSNGYSSFRNIRLEEIREIFDAHLPSSSSHNIFTFHKRIQELCLNKISQNEQEHTQALANMKKADEYISSLNGEVGEKIDSIFDGSCG